MKLRVKLKMLVTTAITTTTVTTTNNKINANSGPRPVIHIVDHGRKYKNKFRRKGWYMQTQAPGW